MNSIALVFDIHGSRRKVKFSATQPGCCRVTLYTARMAETVILERTAAVRHGRGLEHFTVAWNVVEGLAVVNLLLFRS